MYVFPIFGFPRSGTSLVSQIVHLHGIPMSEGLWVSMPDISWSPTHFWADAEFNLLHNRLLENSDDSKLAYGMDIPNPQFLIEYQRLVYIREYVNPRGWGYKDHWLPILWKSIEPLHHFQIKPIFTMRSEQASDASLAQRKAHTIVKANQILKPWRDAISQLQNRYPHALVVDFEKLITTPYVVVKSIADYLGTPLQQNAIDAVLPDWKRF